MLRGHEWVTENLLCWNQHKCWARLVGAVVTLRLRAEGRQVPGSRPTRGNCISFSLADSNQLMPMHFATHWNQGELGRLLIMTNCDIHAATSARITPLRLGNANMDNAFVDMMLSADFDATRETGIEGYKNAYAKARAEELKRATGTLVRLARCAVRRCGYLKVGNFEQNVVAL